MAKAKEELNTLKLEFETLYKKFAELTDEELKIVLGGSLNRRPGPDEATCPYCKEIVYKDDLSRHEQICPMNPFNLQQMRGLDY